MRTRGIKSGLCVGEERMSPSAQTAAPNTARAAPATGRVAHSYWKAMMLMPTIASAITSAPSPPITG
jgi:hypothetical protein